MPRSGEFLRVVDTATESDSRPEHVPNSVQHIAILSAEKGRYDLTVDGFGMIATWKKGDRTLTISVGTTSQTIYPGEHAAGMPGLTFEAIEKSVLNARAEIDAAKTAIAAAQHDQLVA